MERREGAGRHRAGQATSRWCCSRLWLGAATLTLGMCGERAYSFELITREQAQQELAAQLEADGPPHPGGPRTRSSGLTGPQLELLAPALARPLKSPLDIVLRWRTEEGVSIDTSTFRVLYGVLKLDITARVLSNATISATGMEAKGAQLPPGVHRIFVQVSDTARRVVQRELVFDIQEP